MASSSASPLLDHIVILIPHSFLTSPPEWFANLFTFYPGGQHSDGLTENTLVLFPDGSYIEFIAFVPGIDPDKRQTHKWGKKSEGTVIDWALTLAGGASEGLGERKRAFEKIQEAVQKTQTGIIYGDLIAGGRHRPDGELLKWAVAGAYRKEDNTVKSIEPGLLPFWCLDDTKRALRVPYLEPGVAQHPSGAVGVALVSITPAEQKEAEELDKAYDAVLGEQSTADDSLWDVKTLAGEELHTGSQVRLEAVGSAVSVSLALYTTSKDFDGRKVGGKVNEDTDLEIEFVNARS